MPASFLFYDLETFGTDPRRSRIAQFGAIRTNADLDPVEDPIMFFCRPADDLLPSPGACLITGITPQQALAEGLIETFMDAGCIVGPATCGPCLGGHMGILAGGERAIATTNRNFKGRMGSLESEVYLSGPAAAAAAAIAGEIIDPAKV